MWLCHNRVLPYPYLFSSLNHVDTSFTLRISPMQLSAKMNAEKCVVVSGFSRDVDEICAPLGYYTALIGSSLQTFRENLSVPSSRLKMSKKTSWTSSPLKMGPIGCAEKYVDHSIYCSTASPKIMCCNLLPIYRSLKPGFPLGFSFLYASLPLRIA
jgi:hypothetical protein